MGINDNSCAIATVMSTTRNNNREILELIIFNNISSS